MKPVILRIPGPTPSPESVLRAMSKPMINHRGPEFAHLINSVTMRLRWALGNPETDVLTLSTSGTGGLEAAVANFLPPGKKVIAASIGYFGDRFTEIARRYGAEVVPLVKPWGQPLHPDELERVLMEHRDATAVLLTHNETSTGVTNDLQELAAVVNRYGVLVLVDAVSSLSAIPCEIDEWGLDVVVSASQKGWMVPPGLAIMSVSERAWSVYKTHPIRSYYLDLGLAKQFLEKGQTLCTPAISIYYALDAALSLMIAEGMDAIFERHRIVATHFRSRLPEIGAHLFAELSHASSTVSAIAFEDGVDCVELQKRLLKEQNIEVAYGMQSFAGKILRIGHVGPITIPDVDEVIDGLKVVVPQFVTA